MRAVVVEVEVVVVVVAGAGVAVGGLWPVSPVGGGISMEERKHSLSLPPASSSSSHSAPTQLPPHLLLYAAVWFGLVLCCVCWLVEL